MNDAGNIDEDRLKAVMKSIEDEVRKAMRYPSFRSPMEGAFIVQEEADEFVHAVRHETGERVWKEAVQLAAMATRYLHDIGAESAARIPEPKGDNRG